MRFSSVDNSLKLSKPSDVKLLQEDDNEISFAEGDSIVNPNNSGKNLKKIQ
jgi:hypothetical protein